MSERYQNRAEKQRITEAFRVGIPSTFETIPSYKIAPQTGWMTGGRDGAGPKLNTSVAIDSPSGETLNFSRMAMA